MSIATYYWLAKPGIVYGNLLPAVAAYLLASQWDINPGRGVALAVGLGTVIGGACVWNNVLDRRLDAHMERTRRRAIPTGRVSVRLALIYGTGLSLAGLVLLAGFTTVLAAGTSALGWVLYVAVYGYAKRHTRFGTLVGSLAGAVPPVTGYVAVTGRLDTTAVWLFVAMAAWQMPHFYAIALFRLADYQAAHVPVWPAVHGTRSTVWQINVFIGIFAAAALGLFWIGATGPVYAAGVAIVSGVWLGRGIRGFGATDLPRWARAQFGMSLIVLVVWSVLVALPGL